MTESQRNELISENIVMVKAIAIRISETLPVSVELDDLIQNGIVGLVDAATRHQEGRGASFCTFAKYRVRGAMLDSLRNLDWASRHMRRLHKKVEAAKQELAAVLLRNPTESEVAQKVGMTEDRYRTVSIDLRNIGLLSASSRSRENDDLPAPDFGCKPSEYPDAICINEQLGGLLQAALNILPPRYRQVIELYYNREMTMKEIGSELGVNESRVSQMHKRAMEKLHRHFTDRKLTFAALA